MTPLKAIRLRCLDCSAGSIKEVRLCPVHDCELYQYRMGHNPKRKGLGGKPPTHCAKTEVKCKLQTDGCPECGWDNGFHAYNCKQGKVNDVYNR